MFGPIVMVRWPHMLLAAFLTSGMSILATGAWHLLRGQSDAESRVMLRWGLALVAAIIPLQMWVGHATGNYVHKYQPAKFAAIEARWHTEQPAREVLIAIPDEANQRNLFEISVPKLGSFIASGTWDSKEVGLDTFPPEDRPPVLIPFMTFRLMVGLGLLMWAVSWVGVVLDWCGRLNRTRWFLRIAFWSFPSGFVAVLAGLVHRRGRSSALGRLRAAAHQGCRNAVADRVHGGGFPGRLRAGLRRGLQLRAVLYLAVVAGRTGQRPRAHARCHAGSPLGRCRSRHHGR